MRSDRSCAETPTTCPRTCAARSSTSTTPTGTTPCSGQPLWFNVSRSSFTGGENVHAVFILKRDANADCSIYEDCGVFQIDLAYAGGGRFTAQWQNGDPLWVRQQFVRSDGATEVSANAEEIAVSVNDDWQDDPMSRSHNFRFDLGDGLSF